MADFQNSVAEHTEKALGVLRRWNKEDSAKELQREYLSGFGLKFPEKTKLEELLDERHKLALGAEDEGIRLKAIDSSIAMAAGVEKVTNVQNNQINIGGFLNDLKND